MEQERAGELANVGDNTKEDGDVKGVAAEERERECELMKQKYDDVIKEVWIRIPKYSINHTVFWIIRLFFLEVWQ